MNHILSTEASVGKWPHKHTIYTSTLTMLPFVISMRTRFTVLQVCLQRSLHHREAADVPICAVVQLEFALCFQGWINLSFLKRESERDQVSKRLCHQRALIWRAGPQPSTDTVDEGTQRNVWNINTCHRAPASHYLLVRNQHYKHRSHIHILTNRAAQMSDKYSTFQCGAYRIKCDTPVDKTHCCHSPVPWHVSCPSE